MIPYAMLLQAADEHVTAGRIIREYAGFLSFFAVYGAIGFHFQVLKDLRREPAIDVGGSPVDRADRRAAAIGFVGSVLMVVLMLRSLLERAAAKNITLMGAVQAGGGRQIFQIACVSLFFICFALAVQRMRTGWVVAGLVAIAYALRNITTGRWFSNVNPLHEISASLWLGTLLVLAIAGLTTVFRSDVTSDERGRLVATMVSRFSPLALSAAALLGITGVTTAWRHLKHLNALWTTPYGFALDAKLCVVALVVVMGAWNWRRMAPKLGNEEGAAAITRSATTELGFAAIVLAITALLVSLPSPGPSGPPGSGAPVPKAAAPMSPATSR
ncbi:MAG TPA: CopD family protein [Gemmatimonadaceae bacterium]|nr:CopD family protein [Gemmatimonadaceae bacterium]